MRTVLVYPSTYLEVTESERWQEIVTRGLDVCEGVPEGVLLMTTILARKERRTRLREPSSLQLALLRAASDPFLLVNGSGRSSV